ncbi:MAG: hypothetical protein LBN40_02770 [Oscillospiraceae bacterium]|jgi:hypothetical protein|nr:hypothetical protein [Oscillospiraceae bacterium]
MTALVVVGVIVAVFALIIWSPLKITLIFENNVDVRLDFLFFKIYPFSKKKERERWWQLWRQKPKRRVHPFLQDRLDREAKEKAEQDKANALLKAEQDKQKRKIERLKAEQKPKVSFDSEQIGEMIELVSFVLKKLNEFFHKVYIRNFYADCIAGGEDAMSVAMNYGKLCIGLNAGLAVIMSQFDTQVKEVHIEADFQRERTDFFLYAEINIRLAAFGHLAFILVVKAIKFISKSKTGQMIISMRSGKPKQKAKIKHKTGK